MDKKEVRIPKGIAELRTLILDPGPTDRSGYSRLNNKAVANSKLAEESSEKIKEEKKVIELLDYISDFKGPDISRLTGYIRESRFSLNTISEEYSKHIESKSGNLNIYQRTELIRFLMQINPDRVTADMIEVTLANLKNIDPWLYTEILSRKAPNKGLDYIQYMLSTSPETDINRLTHWLTFHMKSDDTAFVKKIAGAIPPLIHDEKIKKLIHYQAKKKGINPAVVKDSVSAIPKQNNSTFVVVSSAPFKKFKERLTESRKTKTLAHAAHA